MWTSFLPLLLLFCSLAPLLHLQAFPMAKGRATQSPPTPHTDTQTQDPVEASHSLVLPSWSPVGSNTRTRMGESVDWFPGLKDSNFTPKEKEKQDETDRFKGIIGEYTDMMASPNPVKRNTGLEKFSFTESDSVTARMDSKPPPAASHRDGPPDSTEDGAPEHSPTERKDGSLLTSSHYGQTSPIPLSSPQNGGSISTSTRVTLFSSDYTETNGFNPLIRLSSAMKVTQLESESSKENTGDQLQDFTETLTGDTGADAKEASSKSPPNEVPFFNSSDATAITCNPSNPSQHPVYPGDCISNQSQHPVSPDDSISNQSQHPVYPDDSNFNQSQQPVLTLNQPLFVPLNSDWNSALATWGFAWEVHIYGLGSVFAALGLISVLCLLGLPLRCPPGSPYFTLLHLFLLAAGGARAFSLLYDAYSHQDLLPPIGSLLLSELPFPCLTSAFSLCFLLLSLRSRMHLPLPLSLSHSLPLSALPRPCFLFFLSLVHFGTSLGSMALLRAFPNVPVLLLIPQGVLVLLCLLLPCSFLLFYCLVRQDTKHILRLSDGEGEVTGSPVLVGRPSRCPFADAEEWRAV